MLFGMREHGLDAPILYSSLQHFSVTLPRYGLLTQAVAEWIEQVGGSELQIDLQRVLALREAGQELSVANIRQSLGMDGEDVRAILDQLVAQGWLEYPRYRQDPYLDGPKLKLLPVLDLQ